MEPTVIAAAVAFGIGYVVGAMPVARLMTRRHRPDLRKLRVALVAGVLEVLKGAVVGLGASLYTSRGWFIAAAVAGCVAGDAFPPFFRRGGRGLLPLVSAFVVAMPTAGVITAIIALPTALLTSMRGRVYDTAVAVAVPSGLLISTRDVRSLAPAAIIVAVLVGRQRLRRRQHQAAVMRGPAWQNIVVDADADLLPPPVTPSPPPGRQNRAPWET